MLDGPVAQLVRAPPCHGGGHGFKSRLGRNCKSFLWILHHIRDLSSAGRASALQAEGHRFEPYRSHFYADVAQLAEQLICNQQVIGSSPIIGFALTIRRAKLHRFCMGGFPSGQRGQTVNLLQVASVVRIHLRPRFLRECLMTRGGAARKLVGLITRRSQVQILSPLFFYLKISPLACFAHSGRLICKYRSNVGQRLHRL